jgi:prepilin-type N-terminal cleavage/methylation domain-containing protein
MVTKQYSSEEIKKMFKMKKNQKGFTLVEVLLVVVILGILAAVALPRFLTTRNTSQLRTCQANISAINAAIEEFHFMHGSWPTDLETDVYISTRFPDGPPQCPAGGDYQPRGGAFGDDELNRVECVVADAGEGEFAGHGSLEDWTPSGE